MSRLLLALRLVLRLTFTSRVGGVWPVKAGGALLELVELLAWLAVSGGGTRLILTVRATRNIITHLEGRDF